MGFLNGFLREGPGVRKDAPKKKGFFFFFEVLGAKFFKLIKANILHFVVSLPFLAIALFVLAPMISNKIGTDAALLNIENYEVTRASLYSTFACGIFNFFGSGPASAGYAYVTRCFSRREHTWIVSDGWDKIKENFKYSIILTIIDIIVIVLAVNAIWFYGNNSSVPGMGGIFNIIKYVIIIAFVIYIMMHIFIYQLMVTYDIGFIELIKHSFIYTIAKLPMCALLLALTTAIFVLLSNLGLMSVIIYGVIGMTFTRFPLEFYASRVIGKDIEKMKKIEQAENEGATE